MKPCDACDCGADEICCICEQPRELRHADERGTRVWHNGSADSNAYCWCWFGERLLALLDDREAKLAAVRHGLREAQRVIRACVDREECRENPDADDWRSLRKRARATLQVQP